MSSFIDNISHWWTTVQLRLFANMSDLFPDDPVTERLKLLLLILEVIPIEHFMTQWTFSAAVGAKPHERRRFIRAYIAKIVLQIETNVSLIDRLNVDGALRRICGWSARQKTPTARVVTYQVRAGERSNSLKRTQKGANAKDSVPSDSTFSRAFAEIAESNLLSLVLEALVKQTLSETITEHVSYDSTAIAARESVKGPKKPAASVSPPPLLPLDASSREATDAVQTPADASPPKRKRGRPKHGEEAPPKEPTVLERQRAESELTKILELLPTGCDFGTKTDTNGHKMTWKGYKANLAVTDDGFPIAVIVTSASPHDSQMAIPLLRITAFRIRSCYDLLDAAYDAEQIYAESTQLNHVPIIDKNCRSKTVKEETERLAKLDRSRIQLDQQLVEVDRARRYNARSGIERFNGFFKDSCGGRRIWVRGHAKILATVLLGVLVAFARNWINFI